MNWFQYILLLLVVMGLTLMIVRTIAKASIIIYEGLMHGAVIANFSRFGEIDPDKLVVIDDSRAYFIRDNSLWTCEVKDDYLIRSTLKAVDVMAISGTQLKEVMVAVDALNMEEDDEDDEGVDA